jgi:hypothetical protein
MIPQNLISTLQPLFVVLHNSDAFPRQPWKGLTLQEPTEKFVHNIWAQMMLQLNKDELREAETEEVEEEQKRSLQEEDFLNGR